MRRYMPSGLQHCFQTGGIGGEKQGGPVDLENFWQLNVQFKNNFTKTNCKSTCEISLVISTFIFFSTSSLDFDLLGCQVLQATIVFLFLPIQRRA